jgi:hypothetical protein
MGDAARKIWGSKGKEMMKSKRVLGIVDKQPAGGAGHRAYPAVFRDKAGGQERSLNLTSKQSLEAIKKAVCMAFNDWYDCEIIDLDSGAAIVLDAEYKSLVIDFESREVARKEDTLEAKLQEARSLVLSTRTDLQYRGCHSLWELACRPDNHSGFEDETFALLCRALGSEELRVRAAAAAALWTLAEVELTLERMPIAQLVPALICAARSRPGDAPGTRPLDPPPPVCDNLQLGKMRTQRAVTSTGRPLAELMQWPLGALHAIAGREPGQRALHKWGGELSLLPMLLMGEAPAKRAVAALIARVAASNNNACAALLHGGAPQLAKMAAGWSASEGWSARCQAADLLHYCLSRVRLDANRSEADSRTIASFPTLVSMLRAACEPLLTRAEAVAAAEPIAPQLTEAEATTARLSVSSRAVNSWR